MNPISRKSISYFLVMLIFLIMGHILYTNRDLLLKMVWRVSILSLVLSGILLLSSTFFSAIIWKKTLRLLENEISLRKSFKILSLCAFGKYIPGKVWAVAGNIYLLSREGVPKEHGVIANVIQNVGVITSGIILSFLLFPFWQNIDIPQCNKLAIFAILLLMLILIHPKILTFGINIFSRILEKDIVSINFKYQSMLLIIFLYLINWLVGGLGFFFMVNALYKLPLSNLPLMISTIALSYTIGFVTLFAPGGIGVREGIMVVFLSFIIPAPIAIVVSIIARIWFSVIEAMSFFIALNIE